MLRDHRRAAGHRLQHGQAKSLVEAGHEQAVRGGVQSRQVGGGNVAGEGNVVGQAEARHLLADRLEQPAVPAADEQAMGIAVRFEPGQ